MFKGTVRFENYNGCKSRGMKNKRTNKTQRMRSIERAERIEAEKQKQRNAYKSQPDGDGWAN